MLVGMCKAKNDP